MYHLLSIKALQTLGLLTISISMCLLSGMDKQPIENKNTSKINRKKLSPNNEELIPEVSKTNNKEDNSLQKRAIDHALSEKALTSKKIYTNKNRSFQATLEPIDAESQKSSCEKIAVIANSLIKVEGDGTIMHGFSLTKPSSIFSTYKTLLYSLLPTENIQIMPCNEGFIFTYNTRTLQIVTPTLNKHVTIPQDHGSITHLLKIPKTDKSLIISSTAQGSSMNIFDENDVTIDDNINQISKEPIIGCCCIDSQPFCALLTPHSITLYNYLKKTPSLIIHLDWTKEARNIAYVPIKQKEDFLVINFKKQIDIWSLHYKKFVKTISINDEVIDNVLHLSRTSTLLVSSGSKLYYVDLYKGTNTLIPELSNEIISRFYKNYAIIKTLLIIPNTDIVAIHYINEHAEKEKSIIRFAKINYPLSF